MLLRLGWITALILILREDGASGEIYFKKGAPHVKLFNSAVLSGKLDYSRDGRPFNSFTGIPFGRVPERFKEPEAVSAWEGIFDATQPGNVCVQTMMFLGLENATKHGEEDCLNLHVYVPMNNTQRKGGLPVMVWIHGGGFSMGSGIEFGPKYFTDEDVILVNVNYRLGIFGFLSTGDSVVPGNNGLKDLVLALQWVQENIGNFGGDNGRVTIFGESAGGALVHYLLLSPTTEGLFHRAISQSGTAISSWAYNPNPRKSAQNLAAYLKCPTDSTEISSQEILTCFKGLSDAELSKASLGFIPSWPPGGPGGMLEFGPVKESKDSTAPFLTESPWSLLLEDGFPHKEIPWMVGVTEDEGAVNVGPFLMDEKLLDELDAKWDELIIKLAKAEWYAPPQDAKIIAGKIRKFYLGDQPVSKETMTKLSDINSDFWFVHGAKRAAIQTGLKGKKHPVYLYQYAHQGPISVLELFGMWSGKEVSTEDEELLKKVSHFSDCIVQFNMNNSTFVGDPQQIKFDAEQEEFSKNFVKLWASFAKYGKPNHTWTTSKDEWKPISKNELDGTSPLKWYRITSKPEYADEGGWKERIKFWDQLYKDHFFHSVFPSHSERKKTEL